MLKFAEAMEIGEDEDYDDVDEEASAKVFEDLLKKAAES